MMVALAMGGQSSRTVMHVIQYDVCCRSVQCSSYQWRSLFLGCKDRSRKIRSSGLLGKFAYSLTPLSLSRPCSRLLDGSIFLASFYHHHSTSFPSVYPSSTAGQVAGTTGTAYVRNSLYLCINGINVILGYKLRHSTVYIYNSNHTDYIHSQPQNNYRYIRRCFGGSR